MSEIEIRVADIDHIESREYTRGGYWREDYSWEAPKRYEKQIIYLKSELDVDKSQIYDFNICGQYNMRGYLSADGERIIEE